MISFSCGILFLLIKTITAVECSAIASADSPELTKKEALVDSITAALSDGDGQLERSEDFSNFFTDDVSFLQAQRYGAAKVAFYDAIGKQAVIESMKVLGAEPPALVKLKGYNRIYRKELDDGIVHTKYTVTLINLATGKKVLATGYGEWTIDEGTSKVSKILTTMQHPESIDRIFEQTDKEAIVNGLYEAWGAGLFNDENTEIAFNQYFTPDVEFNITHKFGAASQIWRDTKGVTDALELMETVGVIAPIENFERIFLRELDDGVVYLKYTATQECLETKKKVDFTRYEEYHIDEGLGKVKYIVSTVQYPETIEAIFEIDNE